MIHVIDDDESFLRSMERRLRGHGYAVATYPSVADFLVRPDPEAPGCVLTDLQMPKRDGFDLQEVLAKSPNPLPVVFVTGKGDIPTSVRAMRAGAEDFLTKRVAIGDLVAAIERSIKRDLLERAERQRRSDAQARIAKLTDRELQMLLGIVKGMQNKEITASRRANTPAGKEDMRGCLPRVVDEIRCNPAANYRIGGWYQLVSGGISHSEVVR
jgi:FixJ family two-component response regulator